MTRRRYFPHKSCHQGSSDYLTTEVGNISSVRANPPVTWSQFWRVLALATPLLWLGAPSQGQTTGGICDRTPQVRTAILKQVTRIHGVSDCARITNDHLQDVGLLLVRGKGVTSLKASDFAGLVKLHSLYLDGNSLTTLPGAVFTGLTKLRSLDLGSNSLTALPDTVFAGLSNLNWLYLSRNSLTSVPDSVFSGLTNLQELHLGSNDLTALPASVFAGLTNLQ